MKTKKYIFRTLIISILLSATVGSFAQECTFGIFKISTKDAAANEQVKTFKSAYPEVMKIKEVDVETTTVMVVDDIKKTKVQGDRITLHFTYKGAKKWAKFTEESVGKKIAFVVNNKVYCMPLVNAPIKQGIAMISGLKDNEEAIALNKFLVKK